MKRILVIPMIALGLIYSISYSQTMDERIIIAKTKIELLLSKYRNSPYKELGEVVDIDSSIGNPGMADGNICDPYGTLNHCYLFMATTQGGQWGDNQKHSIGIFKDSLIIWMSDLLPGSENYGYITDEGFLATKDLNKNGMVDIVVYYSDGTNPPSSYYLWVFSWNGKEGRCINKCEKNGETSIASTGAFDIADINGDGIYEIRSYDSDCRINAVYKWNGSLYSRRNKNHK